jgi:hypothetical protein
MTLLSLVPVSGGPAGTPPQPAIVSPAASVVAVISASMVFIASLFVTVVAPGLR